MLAFTDAITLAFDDGDIGVMGETVEQCCDASGVGKYGVPVFERAIGGDEHGSAFIAAVDDFIKEISGGGVVREVADFVNAEQSRSAIVS